MGEADGYKLEPARKVRSLDERAKQGDLAGAASDARRTQAAIDAANSRVQSIRAAIDRAREGIRKRLTGVRDANPTTSEHLTASSIAISERYVARLRRDLEAALDELDRAHAAHRGQLAAVDDARARLVRARADKEIVERHFARWRDEKRKLAERRED